jgi:DNA-binding CsgD family transcriptional regulator
VLSITAIATAAGVDRRTVYRRFAGRDELLAAVYQARLTGIEKAIRGARFAEAPVPVALHGRIWPDGRSSAAGCTWRSGSGCDGSGGWSSPVRTCAPHRKPSPPWGCRRGRRELRSTGRTSPDQGPEAREKLTPHELSIARLAAEGLTNREIGRRLYLSHRTVGTHLHRIFPKLGVTFRVDLARALPAVPPNCSSASMV